MEVQPAIIETVFTLTKTQVPAVAIAAQRLVEDADLLISGKPIVFQPGEHAAEIVLDFGREIVGTIQFDVRAESPSRLDLRYGEGLPEVYRDKDYVAGWYKRPMDTLEVQAGEQSLVNPGRREFRYLRLIVPEGAAAITVVSVRATLVHYPVKEEGRFSCSDPLLNKVWEISAYSTKLCMQQYYEDGIKRDGLLWISDYRIQYLCNALLFGDAALARKSLLMMAASQSADNGSIPAQASRGGALQHPENINYMPGIPRGVSGWILVNYDLDYIGCVRDYYRYAGDLEAVKLLWPTIQKLIPYLMSRGALELETLKHFITDGRYGESWWGSHCVLEMQFVVGMQDALYLAKIMEDEAMIRQCEEYLPRQRKHIVDTYFDKDAGYFLDEPGKTDTASWHANAFGLLSGMGEYRELAKALENSSAEVRVATAGFMLYWTMEAKFMAGMSQAALNDIRAVYGHMLKFGATTTWEKCDLTVGDHPNEEEAAGSRCHGWSAGPAYFLPGRILGVQTVEPGFAAVRIEPQLCDLEWAEGAIPTPKGVIKVRWEQGDSLTGTVTMPEGVTGTVVLPDREIILKTGENVIGPTD